MDAFLVILGMLLKAATELYLKKTTVRNKIFSFALERFLPYTQSE